MVVDVLMSAIKPHWDDLSDHIYDLIKYLANNAVDSVIFSCIHAFYTRLKSASQPKLEYQVNKYPAVSDYENV